jgi:hypothetical protein
MFYLLKHIDWDLHILKLPRVRRTVALLKNAESYQGFQVVYCHTKNSNFGIF